MIPAWSSAKTILDRFMILSLQLRKALTATGFYEDTGKDLVRRQFAKLRTAYAGAISGLAQILSRIRMRHVNRALQRHSEVSTTIGIHT